MIAGIGVDLVEQARVAQAIARHGERFLSRVLTPAERAALHGPAAQFVSGRLAAKEAVMKALGTGWAQGVSWKHVEVRSLPSGAPEIVLEGAARARMKALGGWSIHVSLTHTHEHAVAMAVIEAPPGAVRQAGASQEDLDR